MPKNSVYGWGTKLDKIDTMRVIATSHHKRKMVFFDQEYPWSVKVKLLHTPDPNLSYMTTSTHPIFVSPFTKPTINTQMNIDSLTDNFIVVTYRFKNEVDVHDYITELHSNINSINQKIEIALGNNLYDKI
jgi:hypothetical protein